MSFDPTDDMISLTPRTDIPSIDDVLVGVFEKHGMPRLGGASGKGWSSYSQYQRCPYLYKLSYVEGLRGVAALALETGSAFHTFMALHYTWMTDENLTLTPEVCREALLDGGARVEAVLAGWKAYDAYAMHYQNDYLFPLAVEQFAQGDNGNTCRFDLIARVETAQAGLVPGTYIVEHKCLHSEEKLFDYATGRLLSMQELHAQQIAPLILAYNEKTRRMVKVQAMVPVPTTIRDVYEVVLHSGRRLRTSDNHPFMTARGWVPAAELTSTDWVAIAPSTGGYDGSSKFTDAEVEFVGMMLGDGCMTNGKFTQVSREVTERFTNAATAIGAVSTQRDYASRAPYVELSMAQGKPAQQLLERLDLTECLAATKVIPNELLEIPDRQVDLLLAGLWNTDGCVDVFEERSKRRPNDPQMKVRIAYVSRSQALCEGVLLLLQRRGFAATICESSVEYEGERRDVWTTKVVTREGKRKFLNAIVQGQIPFVRYSITEALGLIKDGDDTAIPAEYVRQQVPHEEITGVLWQQLKNHSVERDTLIKHGPKKQSAAIQRVLDTELSWVRVSHVLVTERSMMYDITVPDVHNFVCNGIITHNTAARFTADLIEGWHNDGEVIGQIMVWKQAKLDKKYGKLRGNIVNIVGKQKIPQFHRTIVPLQAWHTEQHATDLKIWSAMIEMSKATDTWPKSRANCVNKFGMCQRFHHCSTNEKLVTLRKAIGPKLVRKKMIADGTETTNETVPAAISSTEPLASDPMTSENGDPTVHDLSNLNGVSDADLMTTEAT